MLKFILISLFLGSLGGAVYIYVDHKLPGLAGAHCVIAEMILGGAFLFYVHRTAGGGATIASAIALLLGATLGYIAAILPLVRR